MVYWSKKTQLCPFHLLWGNKELPQCGKSLIPKYGGENRISPMEKVKFPQLVNKEFPWWGNEEFTQLDYQKLSQISPDSENFPRPAVAPVATFCRSGNALVFT